MTSRWPEEERGRGEAENSDFLDRISFDGFSVEVDGSRVGLDGSRGTLLGTDPDGRLEVTWRVLGEHLFISSDRSSLCDDALLFFQEEM